MKMNVCANIEEAKKVCRPLKIYSPTMMKWYLGIIWKDLSSGEVFSMEVKDE